MGALLYMGLLAPSSYAQVPTGATVTRVLDGDTVEATLNTGSKVTVRLIGIDAPQMRRAGAPLECGAQRAREVLRGLVEGRSVTLAADPTHPPVDGHGRSLFYVNRDDAVDVGEAMLRGGWAETYYFQDGDFQRSAAYEESASDAFDQELGVWRLCGGNFHRPAAAPVRLACNRWTDQGHVAYAARRPRKCAVWRANWAHYQALTFIKARWTNWGKAKARARVTLTANMGARFFARIEAYRLREDCNRQFRVYTRVAVVYVRNRYLRPSQRHKRRVFKPDTCAD